MVDASTIGVIQALYGVGANGGIPTTLVTDKTLSLENRTADAKATGNAVQKNAADISELKGDLDDLVTFSNNIFDKNSLHDGRLSIGYSYGENVVSDSTGYYTDLYNTSAGEMYTINKKFNWRQTTLFLYNGTSWVGYVEFSENDDGTLSATVPENSLANKFAITVITSDIESDPSYKMLETLILVKGDSSKIPEKYLAFGETKLNIKVNEDDLSEGLKEKLNNNVSDSDVRINTKSLGRGVLDASIGLKLSTASDQWRTIFRAEIEENAGYFISYVQSNEEYCSWCVTDKDDIVLSIGNPLASSTGVYVKTPKNAKYLYYTLENGRCSTVFKDSEKFSIYGGEYSSFTKDDIIKSASAIIRDTPSKFRGNDIVNIQPSISGESFEIPVNNKKYSTVGVWIRMRYKDSQELTSLVVETNNSTGNSFEKPIFEIDSNWHLLKIQATNGVTTSVKITANFKNELSFDLVLCIVGDNFVRPSVLLAFDQAWQASEDCGLYDYLISNNIPFTITGTLENVSQDVKEKLIQCNRTGLLDIGTYGNEKYGDDYYPCSDAISDYQTALRNLENVYTKKVTYAESPISFGARGHVYTPIVTRAIKDNGYKICKTSANQYGVNSDFDGDLITVALNSYNAGYTNPTEQSVLGCCYALFTHGVSSNPASETDPALYQEWNVVKNVLDYFIGLRETDGLQFINMRQLYELVIN